MNVEATIRENILCYPIIFSTGGDVLHHLLFVIGNGFTWHNGEIVEVGNDPREPWTRTQEEEELVARLAKLERFPDFIKDAERARMLKEIDDLQATVDEVDTRWKDYTLDREEIYPQSDYALIMNVPDDVTEDWAAAVKWGRELGAQNGWKF